MIYQLKFMYDDDKNVNVTMQEEKLPELYKCLSEKSMHFDDNRNLGFWTDLDKVRYVQATKLVEPEAAPATEVKEVESIPEVAEVQAAEMD